MKLLLDTQAFLWFITASDRLSEPADNLIRNPANNVFLSLASLWEIAIKVSLGKLTLDFSFDELVPNHVKANRIELLPIDVSHLAPVSGLPFYHRDPFDRLLIAQAMVEKMPIVSSDAAFDAYKVRRIW